MICRECIFFINIRQAYLISPHYANRISSRTVLFTCVPRYLLDEQSLRGIFGDSVSKIWILRETKDLEQLVKERDQTALRLEQAEISLIRMANSARRKVANAGQKKALKKNKRDMTASFTSAEAEIVGSPTTMTSVGEGKSSTEKPPFMSQNGIRRDTGPLPDVNGSVAAQWIPAESRPSHRPLANYGRRVDTIKWTRKRLKELNVLIRKMQKQYRAGKLPAMSSVFIQFHSQVEAQTAFQLLCHHRPFHMRAHITGVKPDEINWDVLQMPWWERIIRRFAIQAFVAAMVVFWSIPAGVIGMISNIDSLTNLVPFLSFINLLPSPILGLITGLLPAVAMSLLMGFVPILMRSVSPSPRIRTLC
jgi:hypothetical protein